MKYDEVVNNIMSKKRFGKMKGVDVSRIMLSALSNPEDNMDIIHVAGTNGKGSVIAALSSMLTACGFKCGVFTSPHLTDFCERICVNNERISKDDAARIGGELLEREFDCEPTMFDYCLCMALLYFKEQDCDFVLLETGLGGAFDSTNAISTIPVLSVITNIGYDHVAVLGDTIAQIAQNKAGIIKTGTELVISKMPIEARRVIETKASQCEVRLTDSADPINIEVANEYDLSSFVGYGRENAICAITAFRRLVYLCNDDFVDKYNSYSDNNADDFTDWLRSNVSAGLNNYSWRGRLSQIGESLCQKAGINKRSIIIDGAHNPTGVAALRDTLVSMNPEKKYIFIIGMLADKDYRKMLECIGDIAAGFVTVGIDDERALSADYLAKYLSDYEVEAVAADSICKAVCIADEMAQSEYDIAIFGSLYFVGEVYALLENDEG